MSDTIILKKNENDVKESHRDNYFEIFSNLSQHVVVKNRYHWVIELIKRIFRGIALHARYALFDPVRPCEGLSTSQPHNFSIKPCGALTTPQLFLSMILLILLYSFKKRS